MAAFAVSVLGAGLLLVLGLSAGLQILLLGVAAIVAPFALYLLWQVEPAYTLSAAIFLSPIAGNWHELHFPTGADPDRLLLAFGIAQVLFRAPAVRDRPRFKLTAAHAFLAAAVLYALASAYRADVVFSKAPLFRIIDAFGILPFLTFLVAPIAFRTKRQRGILLFTLVALGLYLGLTTLFEMVHLRALVFPRYINNAHFGIHYGGDVGHSSTRWRTASPASCAPPRAASPWRPGRGPGPGWRLPRSGCSASSGPSCRSSAPCGPGQSSAVSSRCW